MLGSGEEMLGKKENKSLLELSECPKLVKKFFKIFSRHSLGSGEPIAALYIY